MPIHDWTRVRSGVYHDFHRVWTVTLTRALNAGELPDGYLAMLERRVSKPEPPVIALQLQGADSSEELAVSQLSPRLTRFMSSGAETARYAMKTDRVVIRYGLDRVVAVIEVVSPGNKGSRNAVASFVGKAVDFLRNGVHFLMINPFPVGPRDPKGLDRLIWDAMVSEPAVDRPADKPLTVASFDADVPIAGYVEDLAVGDELPEAPLFLAPGWYVNVPLEATYLASWGQMPPPIRERVEAPRAEDNPPI